MDVIGVGDLDVDIFLTVRSMPRNDEKVLAKDVQLRPGGMVSNFIVALSRLGTSCGLLSVVGTDEYGDFALSDLSANSVDTSYTIRREGGKTYFCVVMLDGSGEKALIVAPTSCIFPEPEDIMGDPIASARHLHTTLANERTVARAVSIAKENGLTVSLDLEASQAKPGVVVESILRSTDILFLNRQSAQQLTDLDSPIAAGEKLLNTGVKTICVTKGAEGVTVVSSAETLEVPAFRVPVVDSTGAGDCFAAGFVYGFLQKSTLLESARFACAVGALSVREIGGHAAAPSLERTQAFLSGSGEMFEA